TAALPSIACAIAIPWSSCSTNSGRATRPGPVVICAFSRLDSVSATTLRWRWSNCSIGPSPRRKKRPPRQQADPRAKVSFRGPLRAGLVFFAAMSAVAVASASSEKDRASDVVLRVRDLRKVYGGEAVVDGFSFTIHRGECYALLGPNGAGKTTTLRCCLGLTDPDGGTVELLGEPVPRRAREARVRVGVVPQLDNLDPDFSVSQNLLVYGRYFGLPDAAIRERIPTLLEFASLAHKKDAWIGELSGGMKRRLTLARSLVNDPDLIFMDEPTTGLDPQ